MVERRGSSGPIQRSPAELTLPPGDVDAETAKQLERDVRALRFRGYRRVVIDLSQARELTPALVGALLRGQRHLSWRNGTLVVVATAEMREALAWMGLDEAVELVDASARET